MSQAFTHELEIKEVLRNLPRARPTAEEWEQVEPTISSILKGERQPSQLAKSELIVKDLIGARPVPEASDYKFGIGATQSFFEFMDFNGKINLKTPKPAILVIGGSVDEVGFLAQRYPEGNITVVNLSNDLLQEIKQFYEGNEGVSKRLKLYRADATNLDRQHFPDQSFDLVFTPR